jgi:hypothetical protein
MDNAGPFVKKGGKLQFCDLAREAYLFRLLAVYSFWEGPLFGLWEGK